MNEKTYGLLEFDAIRKAVSLCALSEEAGRRINESLPFTDSNAVDTLKRLVSAVLDRLNSGDEEPSGAIPGIAPLLPVLGVEGTTLKAEELYALGIFAERGEALKAWLGGESSDTVLKDVLSEMPDCSAVSKEVFRVLDRDGQLRDLPEFREIKRRIAGLTVELEKAVARYTGDEESRRMLQSAVPSQRDGRTVLAVKANFRGRIKGIVHEVSSTGQTLFVEPEDVVEKNNNIVIEQRRFDAEIRRVLREVNGLCCVSPGGARRCFTSGWCILKPSAPVRAIPATAGGILPKMTTASRW